MTSPDFEELVAEVGGRSRAPRDPIEHLACAVALGAELAEQAEALLAHYVDQARAGGASWTDVGALLGITKQGAQQRFAASSGATYLVAPNRLTGGARAALVQAHREARQHHHPYLGTEHVLLAVAAEDDAACARVVRRLGVTPRRVRRVVEDVMAPPPAAATRRRELRGRQPLTAGAHRAVFLAGREARDLGHDHIGPEHLLLGVAAIRSGPGAVALDHLDVDHDLVRQAVIDVSGGALG